MDYTPPHASTGKTELIYIVVIFRLKVVDPFDIREGRCFLDLCNNIYVLMVYDINLYDTLVP